MIITTVVAPSYPCYARLVVFLPCVLRRLAHFIVLVASGFWIHFLLHAPPSCSGALAGGQTETSAGATYGCPLCTPVASDSCHGMEDGPVRLQKSSPTILTGESP